MARVIQGPARGETVGETIPARRGEPASARAAARIVPDVRPTSDTRTTSGASLRVRFWGVRGSHPVAHALGSRIGVNTTCLEARFGRHVVILDAGSGIVALGEDLAHELASRHGDDRPTVSLLFTHAHHDHLCGLPFFAPLYRADTDLHLFGPDQAGMTFESIIAGYMRAPYFPVDFRDLPSRRRLTSVGDGVRLVWLPEATGPALATTDAPTPPGALTVDVLYSVRHPRDGTLMYRISGGGRSLVFATDVEVGVGGAAAEQRFLRFARSATVLVHDAQYSEDDYSGPDSHRGYGHSTPAMAARMARAAHVERLVLFHHDPGYADSDVRALERDARRVFPNVVTAREGLEISLDGESASHVV